MLQFLEPLSVLLRLNESVNVAMLHPLPVQTDNQVRTQCALNKLARPAPDMRKSRPCSVTKTLVAPQNKGPSCEAQCRVQNCTLKCVEEIMKRNTELTLGAGCGS